MALEASERRAAITRLRTSDLRNVKVVCERIEKFDAIEKFDVVTMIGVLQYARIFSGRGELSELELLGCAARQLKETGVLVIAIQNQLGIKYLSGYPEPNVDTPYFGIEDRYGSDTIIRHGLNELREVLDSVGLGSQEVLFPLPDYHMPTSILTGAGLNPSSKFFALPFLQASVVRDRARPDWVAPLFSIERAWGPIYRNRLTPDLANAFLIVAARTDSALDFLRRTGDFGWHFSVERHPAFVTAKKFTLKGEELVVVREHLQSKSAPEVPVKHCLDEETYVSGSLWWSALVEIVNIPGWSAMEVGNWARRWLNAICMQLRLDCDRGLDLDQEISGSMFDWTPLNCIETSDGKLCFIDKEWDIEASLTLSYLIVRGLVGSLVSVASCAAPASNTPLTIIELLREALRSQKIDITEKHIDQYIAKESTIQNWIHWGVDNGIPKPWEEYVRDAKLTVRIDPYALKLVLGDPGGLEKRATSLIRKESQVKDHENNLRALEGDVKRRETWVTEKESQLANHENNLRAFEGDVKRREKWAAEKESQLTEHENNLRALEEDVKKRESWITDKESHLADHENNLRALEADVLRRETWIRKAESTLVIRTIRRIEAIFK